MLCEQVDYYPIILILLVIIITFLISKFVSAYRLNDLQFLVKWIKDDDVRYTCYIDVALMNLLTYILFRAACFQVARSDKITS